LSTFHAQIGSRSNLPRQLSQRASALSSLSLTNLCTSTYPTTRHTNMTEIKIGYKRNSICLAAVYIDRKRKKRDAWERTLGQTVIEISNHQGGGSKCGTSDSSQKIFTTKRLFPSCRSVGIQGEVMGEVIPPKIRGRDREGFGQDGFGNRDNRNRITDHYARACTQEFPPADLLLSPLS
jgi:hypothetical protein